MEISDTDEKINTRQSASSNPGAQVRPVFFFWSALNFLQNIWLPLVSVITQFELLKSSIEN